jgi:hypothetical protein
MYFEQELGVIAARQAAGLTVQHHSVRRCRFLTSWEPISFSPVGEPPQVLRHCFSRSGAFPKKIFLLDLRITGKLYLRIHSIIFWVRFPKWHAAGRDIHTFLRPPLLEEKSKGFNLLGRPLMICSTCLATLVSSICVGVAKHSFRHHWHDGDDISPCSTGCQRICCYENRTDE